MVRTLRTVAFGAALLALTALARTSAEAKPAFAMKEGVNCLHCHVQPGGPRNFRGLYYAAHKLSFADFDNEYEAKAAGVDPKSKGGDAVPKNAKYPNVKAPAALDFTMKDIDGKPVKLARYTGDVILVVNVASQCGYTPQYADLQKIYEEFKDKGFVVLGFPANEFGMQEPGTDKEIKLFCTEKYKVSFPMFSKIVVKGEKQAPLYKFLTDKETNEKNAGDIKWNFEKFLIDRNGEVVARFPSKVKPTDPAFLEALQKELSIEKPGKAEAEKGKGE
jgi:glutathione peroxidase